MVWKEKWPEVRLYLHGKQQIGWLVDLGPVMRKIGGSGTIKPGAEAVEKSMGLGT